MRIWHAVWGAKPRVLPPVCKWLGLEEWRRGGGGMLLNSQWIEETLLNLYTPLIIDF